VLDAVTSFSARSSANYIIPLIRSKFHHLRAKGLSIQLVWIPSHVGLPGNESADAAARRAALNGHKPKFKIPYTDMYPLAKRSMETVFDPIDPILRKHFERKVLYIFLIILIFAPGPGFSATRLIVNKLSLSTDCGLIIII